ncbi:MAG: hypothetical protein GY733_04675, partial [bacterium]|nr:hypothetical protein [bacterium]
MAACHLAPERGERAEAERRRQLAVIVKSLRAQAKVVMGDLNVSDGEARDLCELHALCDADYASMSWNPAASQYYGPDHGYVGPGYRFDRVLCSGAAWSHAFLVGHEWKFEGGEKFRLSDHYGVFAVVDVHAAYSAANEADAMVAGARRGMVAGRRDDLAAHERVVVAANEAAGQEERRLQAQRLSDEELKKQLRARRREEEQRRKALQALRDVLYGPTGCFGDAVEELQGAVPEALVRADDLELPGVDGISGAEAALAWSRLVQGRYPRMLGLCNPDSRRSFAICVAQVLLRVPAMAVWMTVHERSCGAAASTGGEASSCILCSLWRTRDQLGLRAVPDVLLHLADVGTEYKERQERDVAVFAQRFLHAARTVERDAGRCAPWGSETSATHVDRLFGFWVEARSRCSGCKRTETWFESEDVLSLALPADLGRRSTLHELYLRSCAAGSIAVCSTGADVRSGRCACASCGRR